MHKHVTQSTIDLLQGVAFGGASQEFLNAHDHYRHGRYKETIVDSLKSFESTMKSICLENQWAFWPNDTATKLIQVLFEKQLIPSYLQDHFANLRKVLEGLPTVRNKTSGHGQGQERTTVPNCLAAYALHQAGANIVLLVEAHKNRNNAN